MIGNKAKTVAVLLTGCCVEAKIGLGSDFINGFETGIFVRDDANAFYDYSCEKPRGNSDLAKQI